MVLRFERKLKSLAWAIRVIPPTLGTADLIAQWKGAGGSAPDPEHAKIETAVTKYLDTRVRNLPTPRL